MHLHTRLCGLCLLVMWVALAASIKDDHGRVIQVFDANLQNLMNFKDRQTAIDLQDQKQFGVIYVTTASDERAPSYHLQDKNIGGYTDDISLFFRSCWDSSASSFPTDFQSNFYVAQPQPERPYVEDEFFNHMLKQQVTSRNVTEIYFYTYYFPCSACERSLRHFITEVLARMPYERPRIYVGFSQLFGHPSADDSTPYSTNDRQDTISRYYQLHDFVNQHNGLVVNVTDPFSSSLEDDPPSAAAETAGFSSWDGPFALGLEMDFTSGRAVAWVKLSMEDVRGTLTFRLYDRHGEEKSTGRISDETGQYHYATFDRADRPLSEGDYVRMHFLPRVKDELTLKRFHIQTPPWNKCGYGWKRLNKLPRIYPPMDIRVTIDSGSPSVCIRYEDLDYNAKGVSIDDRVVLQPAGSKTATEPFWPLSQFRVHDGNPRIICLATNVTLSSSSSRGFRFKYLYKSGGEFEAITDDDNASPTWTPNRCIGNLASGDYVYLERQLYPAVELPQNSDTRLVPSASVCLFMFVSAWLLLFTTSETVGRF